ncbi:unnamed protein product, partial [Ectocarpus fasciculatus]
GSGSATGGIGASAMNSGGATQGAQTENEPFSETRSLLAVARAQRSTRRGRSDSTASSCTATTSTACVHVKSQSRDRDADAVSGSAVSGNAVCTHGGTAGMLRAMHSTGAGSAGHVGDDHGPDGLKRSPTLPTAAEGTSKSKDARLASAKLHVPPPSGLVIGNPSGDMATGVGHSTCSSSAGTTTNVSGNGIGSVGSGRACNRAAQATMPLSPANTAASDSVPSVLAAAAVAAAATSRPSSTVSVAGAASLSGEATPPTLANSPRTTPMPSPAPSPLRASKLSASASAPASASAATDPEATLRAVPPLRLTVAFLHPSSFIPSSFILHPSFLHPSSFILHPSFLHPSS